MSIFRGWKIPDSAGLSPSPQPRASAVALAPVSMATVAGRKLSRDEQSQAAKAMQPRQGAGEGPVGGPRPLGTSQAQPLCLRHSVKKQQHQQAGSLQKVTKPCSPESPHTTTSTALPDPRKLQG